MRTATVNKALRLLLTGFFLFAPILVLPIFLIVMYRAAATGSELLESIVYAFIYVLMVLSELFDSVWPILGIWAGTAFAVFVGISWWEVRRWKTATTAGFDLVDTDDQHRFLKSALLPMAWNVYRFLPTLQTRVQGHTVTVSTDHPHDEPLDLTEAGSWLIMFGVAIRSRKSGPDSYTTVKTSLDRDPGIELEIRETGLVEAGLLGDASREYESGDETFDDRFTVELTTSEDINDDWIFTPTVRQALLATGTFGTLTVDGTGVVLESKTRILDPETIERQAEAVGKLAAAIDNASDTGW